MDSSCGALSNLRRSSSHAPCASGQEAPLQDNPLSISSTLVFKLPEECESRRVLPPSPQIQNLRPNDPEAIY